MHGPAEALPLRSREHLVFLIVIEILVGKARLLFAERRCRLGFGIGLERTHIVFGAGDQGDVFDVLAFNRMQQIAHDAGIHTAVVGLRRLAQPSGDENFSNVHVLQRGFHLATSLEIDGDVLYAFWQVMLVTGNAGDCPAGRDQMLRQVAADNAGNAGDQRVALH